ncbi:MAG: MTAP family purine nucleoside phosphorylase [Acidobacteriia bacterium]|nr:MTAP family purine nucleoside phosphorylase [Terriglobia bacterium]
MMIAGPAGRAARIEAGTEGLPEAMPAEAQRMADRDLEVNRRPEGKGAEPIPGGAGMTARTGFITGTGLYTLPGIVGARPQTLATPYGEVAIELGTLGGRDVVFIPRHGKGHTISPGEINYRGNIWAMRALGVERILATSVSGSLVPAWAPGALVLVDQFLNFTSGRADTFYPTDGKLAHVDVTDPYCRTLREQLTASAANLRIPLASGATYACMNGPRFETRAEVEMVRRLGGHLLGQTNYPECVLARELAICYATVGVVSNLAAGMQSSVTATEVRENLKRCAGAIGDLFAAFVREHPEHGDCACRHALDHAEL